MSESSSEGPVPTGGSRLAGWMRLVARVLVLLWAGFWIFFGVASGMSERMDPMGVAIHTIMPGGIFGLLALVALRWERAGGLVIVAASMVVFAAYMATFTRFPVPNRMVTALMLSLPSLAGGMLLLLASRAASREQGAP